MILEYMNLGSLRDLIDKLKENNNIFLNEKVLATITIQVKINNENNFLIRFYEVFNIYTKKKVKFIEI